MFRNHLETEHCQKLRVWFPLLHAFFEQTFFFQNSQKSSQLNLATPMQAPEITRFLVFVVVVVVVVVLY